MRSHSNLRWNCRCDCCGVFISAEDIFSEKAKRVLDTPDSEFTKETYITLCGKCNESTN